MANFCGKCGSRLDEATGLCPACDKAQINRNGKENKPSKKISVKTIIIIIAAEAVVVLTVIALVFTFVFSNYIKPLIDYNSALGFMEEGEYESAIAAFEKADGYKDSEEMIDECNYILAAELMKSKLYEEAAEAFEALGGYKDSKEQAEKCRAKIAPQKPAEQENSKAPEENDADKTDVQPDPENVTWAEDYYRNVILCVNHDMAFDNIYDISQIQSLYSSDEINLIDEMFTFNAIIWAYEDIMGKEHDKIDYWQYDYLMEIDYLSETDKKVLSGFFEDEFSYLDEFPAKEVQDAFDYFYGKGKYRIEELSNGKNFYLSEDGKYFYLQGADGIGSISFTLYFKLMDVEYEGDEAVLSMKILFDYGQDYPYYQIYDYVSGNGTLKTNSICVWEMDNDTAFETLCKENGVTYDDFETAKLRIGKDENGVYIIGWEGTTPGKIKW